MKVQQSERLNKYMDLSRQLKKLRNMKVTVMPGLVGTLEKSSKNLEKRLSKVMIGKRIKTIQIEALLKLATIPRRVLMI